jgi:hypothetical protein
MKNKFKFFKFVSLLFFVVFCVVLFNFKPVVNATGGSQSETWVLKEEIEFTAQVSWFISFTSNNTNYEKIQATYDDYYGIYRLYYDSTKVCTVRPYFEDGWEDDAYRTVTFDTAPTGSLLTWLQANAVKVVENIPVESIEIGFSGGKLWVGQTYQINPTVLPADATDKTVTYYSNNTEVATVSSSGLVTAVATGTATITASAGGKSDTVVFTVVENTYSAGYNDGYSDGYGVGYDEGYSEAYDWVLTQVYEYGISSVPKSDNTYYDNTESFDYVSGYGQAWGLGYDLGYLEGSGMPLTPEEEGIVYNWGYNAGYQAGQEDHSVGSLLKQAFGGVGQLLDYELLPNLTIGGIVIVPLLLGIVFFILKRG